MAAFPLQCIDQPLLPCLGTFDACVINYECSSKAGFSNNESILSNKCGDDSSMSVVESYNKVEFGEQVTQRKVKKMEKKRSNNGVGSSLISSSQYMVGNEVKRKRQKRTISVQNQDKEMKVKKALDKKEETKISEEAPIEYVHVRARRGQATDSHSLAERVRREKIREKMKILQGLVPGCDKVTGKALMLDEIINYVQSLQNQVEFLSLKSAYLSPFFELTTESDSFILTPEAERINAEPPIISDTFTGLLTAPADNYPLLSHATSSLSFDPQIHRPYTLTQDDGQTLWDVIADHQGQKFDNEFGFMTNNLRSFH